MCDIIIFSQFFHYDSISTYTFKLREKNYQGNFFIILQLLQINVHTINAAFLRLREAANKYGVKLIVQVGSYDEDVMSLQALSLEISTPERQAEFVDKLMNIADTHNLDGYVIYYVSPGCPWVRFIIKSYLLPPTFCIHINNFIASVLLHQICKRQNKI
jgi:hypothetical protein